MPHIARERYSELVDAKLRATIVKRVGVICNNRYEGSPKAGAVKVPVRDTEVTVADYNKKTGTAMTHGDTSFLTVNIDKDKAVNELIDGFDAESVPGHLVADRLDSAGYSLALQMETDATVFGGVTAPGSNFDTLKSCTAQEIGTDAYAGLVAADADIADHNGILNGWVLSPKGKALLLNAVDANKRPLFINSVAEGAVPMILGSKTLQSKGAYVSGTPNVVGFAGDWTQAMYGTVEGVQIAIADQATLQDGENIINLFQQNMFAVRAEIEVGFRCDTTVFNKLTKAAG